LTNPYSLIPADPSVFAGRVRELDLFRSSIQDAKVGFPHNFVVVGGMGMGKTSLMRIYDEKLADELGAMSVRLNFTSPETHNVDVTTAFTTIWNKLLTDLGGVNKIAWMKSRFGLSAVFDGTTLSFGYGGAAISREVKLTGTDFIKKLENMRNNLVEKVKSFAILIDDAHFLNKISGFYSSLKNVLEEISIRKLPFLFVLCGYPELWTEIHQIPGFFKTFHEVRNLDEFTKAEAEEAARKPLQEYGKISGRTYEIDAGLLDTAFLKSRGHPTYLKYCFYFLFEAMLESGLTVMKMDLWNEAMKRFSERIDELNPSAFQTPFSKLTKQQKIILSSLSRDLDQHPEKSAWTRNEIRAILKEQKKEVPSLSIQLGRLVKRDLLQRISRGEYGTITPFFLEYVRNKCVANYKQK